ncbi:MAG TPA: hypothetical protein VHY91_21215 [Pirellulales bacterium]|jgi:hypothetical protein|nr:hypothetical protein [Pirellulales bacterium]
MLLSRWLVSRAATVAVTGPARIGAILLAAILAGVAPWTVRSADACPFCAAVSLTFCEEIAGADVAVIAKLVTPAPPVTAGNAGDVAKARFEIVERLKGDKSLAVGKKIDALYFGDSPVGSLMLITGVDPANINWSLPIAITPKARHYLTQALKLPKEGPDRLIFFQDYLEDDDELLARDAYDEFAKTPYAGVKDLKGRISHDKLIAWIQDPKVAPSRRRLYLTMVGVCGQPQDAALLEKMIRSDDRQVKSGLDALIAAYLTLKGPDGLPLIEDLFLKKQDADYTETYSAIMALRFHGQEEQAIPRARLLEALHYMLDRPQLADLVIADLARWQDWAIMDRLVDLFKNATDETSWVRVPVINYLQACPLPKAKEHLAELAKIDPESVKKATNLFPIGAAAPATRDKSPAASTDAKPAGGDQDASKQDAIKPDGAKKDAAKNDAAQSDTAAGSGSRLSRAPAPGAPAGAGAVGAPRLLAWMALASCLLGASFWAILGGGRKTS